MKKTALALAAAVTIGITAVASPSPAELKHGGVVAGVRVSPVASLAQPSSVA
jgi:hypothetical protein